jgi:hypothetical protein
MQRLIMDVKVCSIIAGLGVSLIAWPPASAQVSSPIGGGGPHYSLPPAPPRIEINPRPLLFRRCRSWYVVQNRLSGPVLFPQKHCWWVHG